MTELQCLRGPMDGAAVESDVAVSQRVTLPIAARKVNYPRCCTFMVWDWAEKLPSHHVVYQRDVNDRLVHIETREVAK